MRILHVLNHTRRLNGHVHAAVDLACAQTALGHTVGMASGGGDFDGLLQANSVKAHLVDHTRKPSVLARSIRALHAVMRREKPDVVHAHMMTSAVLAWGPCRLLGIPLVTTVHNEFERSAILMGLGNRVIAVSGAVRDSMQRRGIPADRLEVVLNGTIGSARFRDRDRTPKDLGHPAIVFVGGQHPRKGLPDLLRAFEKVHAANAQARLFIVGEGPMLQEYKALASQLACADVITFTGAQKDPFPWMLGADVFALPSLADPAPLVLSEAREAGCAIVATRVDGIPQMLDQGECGLLVPPSDPDALAKTLTWLISDPARLADWRARSQRGIEDFRIERVAQQTLEVYQRALRGTGLEPGDVAAGRVAQREFAS